jgi:hypothetical protein
VGRTQIAIEPEVHRRARKRANELGISLAEYVRRLVIRDLEGSRENSDPVLVFDLGRSCGSDIASDKDIMIGKAIDSTRAGTRPHSKFD